LTVRRADLDRASADVDHTSEGGLSIEKRPY
jgi:hypothetical protein